MDFWGIAKLLDSMHTLLSGYPPVNADEPIFSVADPRLATLRLEV